MRAAVLRHLERAEEVGGYGRRWSSYEQGMGMHSSVLGIRFE